MEVCKKDLMLHLKSLLFSINRDRKRYNLRMIEDCLLSQSVPVSLQKTTLGQNLNYLIHAITRPEGLKVLLNGLRVIMKHEQPARESGSGFDIGMYIQLVKAYPGLSRGTHGVVLFPGDTIRALFWRDSDMALVEQVVSPADITLIQGTTIGKDQP